MLTRASVSTIPLLNLSLLLSISVAGLSAPSPLLAQPEIIVAAASDLLRLQPDLAASALQNMGVRTKFVSGSSGMLSRQVANGAPFDVFLSANRNFVDELVRSGHLKPDSVTVYAVGRVALWSAGQRIRRLEDLAKPGVRHVAIANPTHAPYGFASQQLLEKMGLWKSLQARIVYGENVRQAFQFAESGNAEVALTAWSLVFDRGGILLPAEGHDPILQAGGIVAKSRQVAPAQRFLNFLSSAEGRRLLRKWGLFPPP